MFRFLFFGNHNPDLKRSLFMLCFFSILILNFYFVARFTVDDAFITWRHAANFLETGFWSYNPQGFDITHSYTNLLYSLLSFIPLTLGIDIVLFFKIISILTIVLYLLTFYSFSKGNLIHLSLFWVLLIFPVTNFHIYSGLETFLYVFLLSILFISLHREDENTAVIFTILLLIIRPEAYLLSILVPILVIEKAYRTKEKVSFKVFLTILIGLTVFLQVIFNFYKTGFIFPNTFYVKESLDSISMNSLWFFPVLIFFSIPIVLSKKWKIATVFLIYNFIVCLQYQFSTLSMDYQFRFLFHLIIPTIIFGSYIITRNDYRNIWINKQNSLNTIIPSIIYLTSTMILLSLATIFTNNSGLIADINYYPRVLNSYAYFGNTLKNIDSNKDQRIVTALFDAGSLPYNSGAINLDNLGLGSSYVAHNSFDSDIIRIYDPNIIFIPYGEQNSLLLKYANTKEVPKICTLYFRENYAFDIYSNIKSLRSINGACSKSRINIMNEEDFFLSNLDFPWNYWREF